MDPTVTNRTEAGGAARSGWALTTHSWLRRSVSPRSSSAGSRAASARRPLKVQIRGFGLGAQDRSGRSDAHRPRHWLRQPQDFSFRRPPGRGRTASRRRGSKVGARARSPTRQTPIGAAGRLDLRRTSCNCRARRKRPIGQWTRDHPDEIDKDPAADQAERGGRVRGPPDLGKRHVALGAQPRGHADLVNEIDVRIQLTLKTPRRPCEGFSHCPPRRKRKPGGAQQSASESARKSHGLRTAQKAAK